MIHLTIRDYKKSLAEITEKYSSLEKKYNVLLKATNGDSTGTNYLRLQAEYDKLQGDFGKLKETYSALVKKSDENSVLLQAAISQNTELSGASPSSVENLMKIKLMESMSSLGSPAIAEAQRDNNDYREDCLSRLKQMKTKSGFIVTQQNK